MSFLNFNKYNRSKLSEDQRVFLGLVLPWAGVIQDYCLHKSMYRHIYSPVGIRASVIAGDIILRSNWGTHPVSQKKLDKKLANNLSLLESNELWEADHDVVSFEGKNYRSYEDWGQYSQDASDFYVGSGKFDRTLITEHSDDQRILFCLALERVAGYQSELLELILEYGLHDFDVKYG